MKTIIARNVLEVTTENTKKLFEGESVQAQTKNGVVLDLRAKGDKIEVSLSSLVLDDEMLSKNFGVDYILLRK